ncbi:MAG: hypothetical protein ACYSTZ_07125, partial [Planctomycetota bacterium]
RNHLKQLVAWRLGRRLSADVTDCRHQWFLRRFRLLRNWGLLRDSGRLGTCGLFQDSCFSETIFVGRYLTTVFFVPQGSEQVSPGEGVFGLRPLRCGDE